jgi:hypothetical protein
MRKSVTQNDVVRAFSKTMPKFITVKEEQIQKFADLMYEGNYVAAREVIISHALRLSIDMLYKEMHKNDKNV